MGNKWPVKISQTEGENAFTNENLDIALSDLLEGIAGETGKTLADLVTVISALEGVDTKTLTDVVTALTTIADSKTLTDIVTALTTMAGEKSLADIVTSLTTLAGDKTLANIVTELTTMAGSKTLADIITAIQEKVTITGDTLVEQKSNTDATAYEVATLTITAEPTGAGDVTITLNGVDVTVAVLDEDTINGVATKIRAGTFTGWKTGGEGAAVTFTCNTFGTKTDAVYSPGTTGAAGTMETTVQGTTATLTFAENIAAIGIYNTDAANPGVFTVNGIDLTVPPSTHLKYIIGGVPGKTVTVTGAATYIVSRYV